MVIKNLYEKADDADTIWIWNLYRLVRVSPGVINRGPAKYLDHEAHDDYLGLCAAAAYTDSRIPAAVCAHGRESRWTYDNTGSMKKGSLLERAKAFFRCWHFRLPGVVQHYKLCAGERLGLLDQVLWALGFIRLTKGMSGIQLDWLRFRVYRDQAQRYWACDLAADLWEAYIRRKFPNLMGDVFLEYYGADHVFTRWMQGRI